LENKFPPCLGRFENNPPPWLELLAGAAANKLVVAGFKFPKRRDPVLVGCPPNNDPPLFVLELNNPPVA